MSVAGQLLLGWRCLGEVVIGGMGLADAIGQLRRDWRGDAAAGRKLQFQLGRRTGRCRSSSPAKAGVKGEARSGRRLVRRRRRWRAHAHAQGRADAQADGRGPRRRRGQRRDRQARLASAPWNGGASLKCTAGSAGPHGSGYLLAPDLVLTARHVVEGLKSTELRLFEADELGFPGRVGDWQDARVAWVGADDDLALLAPKLVQRPFRALAGTTTIGRIDGRAPVRVHALGFPRAMAAPTHSDTLQLEAADQCMERRASRVDAARRAHHEAGRGRWLERHVGRRGVCRRPTGRRDQGGTGEAGCVHLRATPAYLVFQDAAAAEALRDANVEFATEFVDASYVEKLPLAGTWGGRAKRMRARPWPRSAASTTWGLPLAVRRTARCRRWRRSPRGDCGCGRNSRRRRLLAS